MYLLVPMVVITYTYKCTCLNIIQQNTKQQYTVKLHINIYRISYENLLMLLYVISLE